MTFKFAATLIAIALCVIGCSSRPDENDVRKLFTEKHPAFRILEVRMDEDEVAARTFIIQYRDLSQNKKFEEMWLYFDSDKPEWQFNKPNQVK